LARLFPPIAHGSKEDEVAQYYIHIDNDSDGCSQAHSGHVIKRALELELHVSMQEDSEGQENGRYHQTRRLQCSLYAYFALPSRFRFAKRLTLVIAIVEKLT